MNDVYIEVVMDFSLQGISVLCSFKIYSKINFKGPELTKQKMTMSVTSWSAMSYQKVAGLINMLELWEYGLLPCCGRVSGNTEHVCV